MARKKKEPKLIEKVKAIIGQKKSVDDFLDYLATSLSLWDMRAWDKFKDPDEVGEWIDQEVPDHKNDGHAGYCIQKLKELSVDKEWIMRAIMSNNNQSWKQRLSPCMKGSSAEVFDDKNLPNVQCEKVRKQGHYGGGICNECQGKPAPIEFEIVTAKGNKVQVHFDRAFNYHFEFHGMSISETGYRSHFLGFIDDDVLPNEKVAEVAKACADKFEIDVEFDKKKLEKKKRGKKNGVSGSQKTDDKA
jgi:hypothetical protein